MIASQEHPANHPNASNSRLSERVNLGRRAWNAARIAGAVAAVSATGVIAANRVGEISESRQTEIPTAEEVQKDPDAFVERTAKPGDSFDSMAMEYTPEGHDYKVGAYNLDTQIDGDLMAGDKVMVPSTTVPPEKR